MNVYQRVRLAGRSLIACALAAPLGSSFARGQTAPEPIVLERIVVSATRTPNDVRELGSAVDKITAAEVSRQQFTSLAGALAGPAGAPVTTGAAGGVTSVFLRGSNSNQTLVLVDGLRLGDSNAGYFNYLGGATPSRFDAVEVVRGPQSTLYGADAVGGAISINAGRGRGALTTAVTVNAGSFGTYGGSVAAQGERGPWGYSAFIASGHTDNERENNAFDSTTLVLRVDRTLTAQVSVGATVRGFISRFESPDSTAVNDPNNFDREQNWLATTFAEFKPSDDLTAKLTVGGQLRRVISETPAPNPGWPVPGILDNQRAVIDGQATYSGLARNRITGGVNAETGNGQNTNAGDHTQSQWGVFLQDEINPLRNVFVTGGLRYDDFNRFGDKTTGRATVAWLVVPERLKLRSSYGTAFRTPGFTDLYGFYGNPDIRPETAQGGDAGFDLYLPDQRVELGVSYFQNRYRDLIVYPAPAFTPDNVGRARTSGVEVSGKVGLTASLTVKAAYTYLDAYNQTDAKRLARRPRHAVDLDVANDFGGGFTAGVGAHASADSADIDAVTYGDIKGQDYVTARLYAAWDVNKRLTLKARVENLFDQDYAVVNGFPSLGIGAYFGAEWRF